MDWLRQLRIGYVPYGPALDFPGDRRRFGFYASTRNVPFEIVRPGETYDVVVVTEAADVTVWGKYPRGRTKIVFDFPDSYLSVPKLNTRGMLRGVAKFAVGQNRRLRVNYWSALQDMCRRADATVCCTLEQQARIRPFCANTHIILDAHFGVVRSRKEDYNAGKVFHFAWEGLAHNLEHLLEIRDALQDLQRKRPFLIHAVTELQYGKFLGRKFGKRNTINDALKIWPGICLYGWNERTFSSIMCCCDLALVPIPLDDPFCAEKPENRLLLFWRAGMPVLASATAAHKRVMGECGLDMAPATPHEWREALEYYTSNEHSRKRAGEVGRAFADTRYSLENMLSLWDRVFGSIFDQAISSETARTPEHSNFDSGASFSMETAGPAAKTKAP